MSNKISYGNLFTSAPKGGVEPVVVVTAVGIVVVVVGSIVVSAAFRWWWWLPCQDRGKTNVNCDNRFSIYQSRSVWE